MDRTGARLQFCLHEYDISPEGRMFFTLRIAVAEYEKHKIRERTQRGIKRKLRLGGIPWGIRAYGYTWDRDAQIPRLDPERAEWVRQIFSWCADEAWGAGAIAARLNELAVPPPQARNWQRQQIHLMLRNPIYKGELVLNRTDQRGRHRNRFLPKDQRARSRPKPASEWYTVAVEPVVDGETWYRAQETMRRRRRRGTSTGTYLLTGLAVCGICGSPCHGIPGGKRTDGTYRRYYVCHGRRRHLFDSVQRPGTICDLRHLPAEAVEAAVKERALELLSPGAYEAALAAERRDSRTGQDAERIRRALTEAEAEWDRRVDVYQQGLVRDAAKALRDIEESKRRVETLRRQLEHMEAATTRPRPNLQALAVEIRGRDSALSDQDWIRIISAVADRVELHPDRVHLRLTPL